MVSLIEQFGIQTNGVALGTQFYPDSMKPEEVLRERAHIKQTMAGMAEHFDASVDDVLLRCSGSDFYTLPQIVKGYLHNDADLEALNARFDQDGYPVEKDTSAEGTDALLRAYGYAS